MKPCNLIVERALGGLALLGGGWARMANLLSVWDTFESKKGTIDNLARTTVIKWHCIRNWQYMNPHPGFSFFLGPSNPSASTGQLKGGAQGIPPVPTALRRWAALGMSGLAGQGNK